MSNITGSIMGKRIMSAMIVIVLAAVSAFWVLKNVMTLQAVYEDENQEEILYNPLMGYAPRAGSTKAVGENTLVYIDVLWSEIEPQRGVYDFEALYEKNHILKYKTDGKKAVFRLVCDLPGSEEHMDIPQWLYDITGDGSFYDISYGKGYSPNYANETFIQAHNELLNAISKEFSQDNFIAYIELGSIGHWGEWHIKDGEGLVPVPTEAVCMQYVKQYVEAFPDICLLMRRPFRGVKEYGLGVYNDMVGEPESTSEWMGWILTGGQYTEPADVHTLYPIPDYYKKAPVGGEFTSRFSWEEMLVNEYERTRDMIAASHMTFIGPKSPHIRSAQEFQKEADALRAYIGYKLGIQNAAISYNKLFKRWNIRIQMNNKGAAPIYYDWDCCMYVYDGRGSLIQRIKLPVNISDIMPGETYTVQFNGRFDIENISKFTVGIEDPMTGSPAIRLNNVDNAGNEGREIVIFSKDMFGEM